jgi:peptide/nickel transport system substrate-binding protein
MSSRSYDYPRPLVGLNARLTRRMFLGFTASAAAFGLLAACGEADDAEEEVAAEEPDTDDEPEPEDDEEDVEEPEPEDDDDDVGLVREVEIPQFDDPPAGEPSGDQPEELIMAWGTSQFATHGIDPQRHVGTIAENQLRHMYEPLIMLERDLTTLSPVLATSWERIDDLTVRFELREGVEYHNGEPFNAEAVRYSVLRPLSDETPGDARGTYTIIEDVEVVDEYTVDVITSAPDPALLSRMTGFHMTMVAPEWAAQGPDVVSSEANGTGPYRFVSWAPEEDLVMEANEDYWGEVPDIQRVRLTTIVEQATRVAALRAGDVHVAKDMPPEEVEDINASGRARALRAVSNRVPFYFITVEIEPFNDPLVRQAINYAANVDGVIETILLGNANRVATMLPIWAVGYDPSLEPYPHDPERARELLEEAGYPDGIDIQLWHIEGRYMKDREVAEAMASEMAAANIRCTTELREAATITEMQQAKETPGLIFASWGNWIFDADNTFIPLLGCRDAEDRDFDWTRPYGCNPELEELMQEARTELDEERRFEIYAEIQQYIYDEAVCLFMYQLVDIFGVDNWVDWGPRHDEMMWAHEMRWNV